MVTEAMEAAWLASGEPRGLAALAESYGSGRSWPDARVRRLALCALVRRRLAASVRGLGHTRLRGSREALSAAEFGEDFALGRPRARSPAMLLLADALEYILEELDRPPPGVAIVMDSIDGSAECRRLLRAAHQAVLPTPRLLPALEGFARPEEEMTEAAVLRSVLGSPWRKPWVPPADASLARTAQEMAVDILARRRPGLLDAVRLGVLADCLEEAGSDDALRLAALRSAGPHPAGFWALRDIAWAARPGGRRAGR